MPSGKTTYQAPHLLKFYQSVPNYPKRREIKLVVGNQTKKHQRSPRYRITGSLYNRDVIIALQNTSTTPALDQHITESLFTSVPFIQYIISSFQQKYYKFYTERQNHQTCRRYGINTGIIRPRI